ncbi:glycosyltransferase [Aquabacter sp. P-9]|uniref:glycosyltransferase n=1 Tax=Aquabacter sediminis TaxID=3029197 RepID=UPI00237DE57E|nr:glycosyltransferase [Aquabacter sp. P-9]MDE1568020.1 glycosyltransferase [Aquabacter sp. P-9]
MKVPHRVPCVAYPEAGACQRTVTLSADRKSLLLSGDLSIACKHLDDLSAITVETAPHDEGVPTLYWPVPRGYVRVYLRLDSLLATLDGATTSATGRARLALHPLAGSLTCEWVAILRREEQGAFLFHRKLADNVAFTAAEPERTWDVALPRKEDIPAASFFLGFQLPAAEARFRLRHFSLRLLATESENGALTASLLGFVEGWSLADDATLQVFAADEETAWTQPVGHGRFTLPLSHPDAPPPTAVRLVSGDTQLAYLDVNTPAQGTQAAEGADGPSVLAPDEAERLYEQGRMELLWMLSQALSLPTASHRAPGDRYALDLFRSRALLDLNAAESAYGGLKSALSDIAGFQTLSPNTQRRLRMSFVRACLRSGRVPEAEKALQAMQAADPFDWEIYFQLATMTGAAQPRQRETYLHIADTLNANLPTPALTVILEDLLAQHRTDEAWVRALKEIKTRGARGVDLWLSLANIHLARGDRINWAACTRRMFAENGLSEPDLEVTRDPGEDVFHRLAGTAEPGPMAEADPRVTVIMTAYNAERTIKAAVLSVLAQTYGNLRLVVVDDRSTDDTRAILAQIQAQDDRLEILQTPFNAGTYFAKNLALATRASDYFTFHDSDDWMHPERIALHMEAMRSDPRLACTMSRWYRMDQRGTAVARRAGGYVHDNPASTFFHASLIKRIGYFDCVRTGADTEFIGRIRRRFGDASVQVIAKPLAIGLHHSASLTRSGAAAFDEHRYSAPRLAYWEAWVDWHRRCVVGPGGVRDLYLPFPHHPRRFQAPLEILSERAAELLQTVAGACSGDEPTQDELRRSA